MNRSIPLCWAICIVTLLFAPPTHATLITFDDLPATIFSEDPAPTSSGFAAVRTGALTSLEFIVDGVTVTITREGGAAFDVSDNVSLVSQQGKSPSFGTRSLDPFFDSSLSSFIFSFSVPVQVFSILAGDYGGDDSEQMAMIAYAGANGTGAALDQDLKFMDVGTPGTWTHKRFDVSHPNGFLSVKFVSVGLKPSTHASTGFSVFVDRLFFDRSSTVAPPDDELNDPQNLGSPSIIVPEPATMALLGLGSVVMLYRRGRSQR